METVEVTRTMIDFTEGEVESARELVEALTKLLSYRNSNWVMSNDELLWDDIETAIKVLDNIVYNDMELY